MHPRTILHRGMGLRRILILIILGAGLWAFSQLNLSPADLIPNPGGLQVAGKFFSRALSPALTYEAEFVPANTQPLLWKALQAAGTTVVFAAAAMSLALVAGLILGFLASTAWWVGDPAGGRSRVYETPVAALLHHPEGGLGDVERPLEMNVDDDLEFFGGKFHEGLVAQDARVVDQDIKSTALTCHIAKEIVDTSTVGYVQLHGTNIEAFVIQVLGGCLDLLRL